MPAKLEYTFEAVKQRLKDSRCKASVYLRDGMLYLQATLPPKLGSDRPKPYQQKISLGVPATEAGYKRAENEARLLSSRLIAREFDWIQYVDSDRLPENRTARSWINEFKKHYFETHSLKEATWRNDWGKIYKRLPQNEPVTLELLKELVFRTERDTRNRLETCNKLQSLADFIGLKMDLKQYRGNYGASKVSDRSLPSDEDIARYWYEIPNAE